MNPVAVTLKVQSDDELRVNKKIIPTYSYEQDVLTLACILNACGMYICIPNLRELLCLNRVAVLSGTEISGFLRYSLYRFLFPPAVRSLIMLMIKICENNFFFTRKKFVPRAYIYATEKYVEAYSLGRYQHENIEIAIDGKQAGYRKYYNLLL